MHPFLSVPKQLLIVGLLWSPICFLVIFLTVTFVGISWGDAALWVVPPMIAEMFVCLSTWFFCRTTMQHHWRLLKTLLAHVVAALILTGLWIILIILYSYFLDDVFHRPGWTVYFPDALPVFLAVGITLYFMAILGNYLLLVVERNRRAEQDILEQKLMKGEAELRALKATVHPHFLFNCFNMLGPLMRKSMEKAETVVSRLSDFLVYSLRYGDKEVVTLRDEMTHIGNYLEIEAVRLEERLHVDKKIDDELLDAPMLPLTLLPLVENAIKHGIGQCLEGGTLSISITRDRDYIFAVISNPYDPAGRKPRGQGMGLKTLRQRFRGFYRHRAYLDVKKDGGVFRVEFRVPITIDEEK